MISTKIHYTRNALKSKCAIKTESLFLSILNILAYYETIRVQVETKVHFQQKHSHEIKKFNMRNGKSLVNISKNYVCNFDFKYDNSKKHTHTQVKKRSVVTEKEDVTKAKQSIGFRR